jgi:Tfp pilus assembly protein PilN
MIRINLSPSASAHSRWTLRAPALGLNLGMLFGVLYLGAVAGLGGYWWSLAADRTRLNVEINRAQQELTSLKAEIGKGASIKSDVADMRKRVEVIEALTKDQGRPILLFDAFADMIPRDLWITGLEEKNSLLRVSGTAFTTVAVSDFMANLRASGRFKEVDIVISRQDHSKAPRLVTFEVTCRFES